MPPREVTHEIRIRFALTSGSLRALVLLALLAVLPPLAGTADDVSTLVTHYPPVGFTYSKITATGGKNLTMAASLARDEGDVVFGDKLNDKLSGTVLSLGDVPDDTRQMRIHGELIIEGCIWLNSTKGYRCKWE